MAHYTKDLNEVIKGLKKASKLHAAQAKKLEKINKDQKTRYKKKKVTRKKK
mgnify:FL=1|jgi:hypothetical protein|tara:strand:+ start:1656 stop:1808 length:153 start_codon:yes stop_codon:yes gene_type:complete